MDPKLGKDYLPVILVLLLGVGLTVTLAWTLFDRESRFQSTQFEKDAMLYSNAVQHALENSSRVVSDLANYFYLNQNLSREEFSLIAQSYLQRDGSIQALEWVPIVTRSQRESFETRAKEFYPTFQFTDKDNAGNIVRAGESELYFPVYYLEPYKGNEKALGHTPLGSTVRNDAINRAIKAASSVASGRVNLIQDPNHQSGLLIFTPVFSESTLNTVNRLNIGNLKGFTLGVFKVGDVTEKALFRQKSLPLNLSLYNAATASSESFLYGHNSQGDHFFDFTSLPTSQHPFKHQTTFNLLNQDWLIVVQPQNDAYKSMSLNPIFVFVMGLLISFYAAVLVFNLRRKQVAKEKFLSAEIADTQLTLDNKDTALIRQNNALTHLTQSMNQFTESLDEPLEDITETAGITLNASYVSAWFFDSDQQIIQCFDYCILENKEHERGFEMRAEHYPQFFEAIKNGEIIVADDVYKDPRTCEFEDDYLTRYNIKSMLVVPLRHQGKIVGAASVEQSNHNRAWSIEEIHFVNSIASFIALAVESVHRHQAELKLKQSSDRLALINNIANGTRSCLSASAVINMSLSLLADEFPDYRVSYAQVSKNGIVEVLECFAPKTMNNVLGAKVDLKAVPEFLSRILKQEPIILSDLLGDSRLQKLKQTIVHGQSKALLSYSLTRHNEKVDFVVLEHSCSHNWLEHEILMMKEVSEYLELAIRDARGQEARRRAEKALDSQKEKLEYLVEERTAELRHKSDLEEMVANLSTKFINLPVDEYDEVIYNALQSIGSLCRAERANLNEVQSDELTVIKSHEWLAPGIDSVVDKNQEFKLDNFPWVYKQLNKRNIVYFDNPEMMPSGSEIDRKIINNMGVKSFISIPIVYGLKLSTIFNLSTQNYEANWSPDEITLLQLVGNMLTNVVERKRYEEQLKRSERLLRRSNKKLRDLATIDGLTGIANRRFFDTRLESEFNRAKREQYCIALILFDIDFFKQFNDEFGHVAGDLCLKRVATAIKDHCQRASELAARYGGEEFAVIVSGASEEQAFAIADRIRQSVQSLAIDAARAADSNFLTLSCGVASFVPSMEQVPQDIIEAADKGLYKAKSSGRNCAKVAGNDSVVEFIRKEN